MIVRDATVNSIRSDRYGLGLRSCVRDCTRLLGKLVPVIIALMMDNPSALWGDAVYPVVDQDN